MADLTCKDCRHFKRDIYQGEKMQVGSCGEVYGGDDFDGAFGTESGGVKVGENFRCIHFSNVVEVRIGDVVVPTKGRSNKEMREEVRRVLEWKYENPQP